jgi:hypothetical protein
MTSNTITSIFDNLLTNVEEFDINNVELDINPENMSIGASCIKNYYKIKIRVLLSTITSPDGKISMLNKLLPEIYDKMSILNIEPGYKFKISEYIIKEILTLVDTANNQLLALCQEKNINVVYGHFIKIEQLEKNILQMFSSINLTFGKQYEVLILERIIKIFSELDVKFKKIFSEETYSIFESKTVLNSYVEMCIIIKHVMDQLSKIDIPIVKNFIKVQITGAYDKYYLLIDKAELSLDGNYLLLNTLHAIIHDIEVLQLDSNNLTRKYNNLHCKTFNKITSTYSERLLQIIKININCEVLFSTTGDIITIFEGVGREYLEEELYNRIFTDVLGKLSNQLTNIFISNNGNIIMEDDLIINLDIWAGELADGLLSICKTHNLDTANIINIFKKIKLVRDYYAFVDCNEELIKEKFITEYGNLELFEQLASNKKHKFHSMSKISNFTAGKISAFTTLGINYFKKKM